MCPICRRKSVLETKPFCSDRCRTIDLGRWLGGDYRVPSDDLVPTGGGGEGSVDEPDVAVGLRKVPPEP
jgi:endogenous inhibitor of DNA gyrase (YacG/DUF329 family)